MLIPPKRKFISNFEKSINKKRFLKRQNYLKDMENYTHTHTHTKEKRKKTYGEKKGVEFCNEKYRNGNQQ